MLTFGDSVLVVGDSRAIKVHVHTTDPGQVLTYGAGQGAIGKVIVENMQEQYQEYLARQNQAPAAAPPPARRDGHRGRGQRGGPGAGLPQPGDHVRSFPVGRP